MKSKDFDKWFAGFFDGEGYVKKNKHSRGLGVSQSLQKERPVINIFKRIQQEYGGKLAIYETPCLPQIKWCLYKREEVVCVIKRIQPYILLRKKAMSDVLKFFKNCRKKIYLTDKEKELLNSNLSYNKIESLIGCSDSTICRMKKNNRNWYYQNIQKC